MKGKALITAMMAMAMSGDKSFLSSTTAVPEDGRVIKPITPPIPKGCTEYEFEDGFKCYALNYKNAIKKHNKWLKNVKK
jgi:hypothetical protein